MTEFARSWRLFLGSYACLFLLLALRFRAGWLQLACLGFAVVGLADMAQIVWRVSAKTEGEPIRVTRVSDVGGEVAAYVATYLLPFLTVADPTSRDVAAYVLFIAIAGLIYARSEMAQINPTLYLLGRKVVHVRTDGGWEGFAVVRSSVQEGTVLRVVPLNALVRVEVKRNV